MNAVVEMLAYMAIWAVVLIGEGYVRTGEAQWRAGYWISSLGLAAGYFFDDHKEVGVFLALLFAVNGVMDERRAKRRRKGQWPNR